MHARRWDHHEHDHGRRSIAGDMPTFGVAMGNAHLDVAAIASEVGAHHHEDGVAQILERWF